MFVKNAADEMMRQNCSVTVLAPVSWVTQLKRGLVSFRFEAQAANVFAPLFMSLPLTMAPSKRLFSRINDWRMASALRRHYKKRAQTKKFDVCYAHFLPSGLAALAAFNDLPVFLTMGESSPWLYDDIYGSNWCEKLDEFTGIFAVSESLYSYLLDKNPKLSTKLHLFPNGVDTNEFTPIDKTHAREHLNLAGVGKLAVFVGNFQERKGPLRVLAACQLTGTKAAFLGSGEQTPSGSLVCHTSRETRERLKLWLAAADCFVLPSLSEGRSNAILEALAMGTPCVVSDRPFNREFLTNETAVLVDPISIEAIAEGMEQAMATERSGHLREAGRALAKNLSHMSRIENILKIMRQASGYRFESDSDMEVILNDFEE